MIGITAISLCGGWEWFYLKYMRVNRHKGRYDILEKEGVSAESRICGVRPVYRGEIKKK